MPKIIKLEGKTIGSVVVLHKSEKNKQGNYTWLCKCVCGNYAIISGGQLTGKNNVKISCGCKSGSYIRHGLGNSKLYYSYKDMIKRCYNINSSGYHKYGGIGITVCKEWLEDITIFSKWAILNGYKEGLTIDRIDPLGNYTPENCRWVTKSDNSSRTSRSIIVEMEGESHSIRGWSAKYGIHHNTVFGRLKRGYNLKQALSNSLNPRRKG